MSTQHVDLSDELVELTEEFRRVATLVSDGAHNLERALQPPTAELIAHLESVRKRFNQFRAKALRSCVAEEMPSPPAEDSLRSLGDLDQLLKGLDTHRQERELRRRRQERMQKCTALLDRVLKIRHKDDAKFAPLESCFETVRRLRESAAVEENSHDETTLDHLAEGKHPFCELLDMIEKRDEIDDQRWEQLQESITQSFGKGMAIATMRGKLVLGSGHEANDKPSIRQTMSLASQKTVVDFDLEDGETPPRRVSPVDSTQMEILIPELAAERNRANTEDPSRRAMSGQPWWRSPLSAEQERSLTDPGNGISVLFGSSLAGLDDVERFLDLATEGTRIITMEATSDRGTFLREMDTLLQDRPNGMIIGIVPAFSPWTEEWVLRTADLIKRKTSREKQARIIFLADPEGTWSWVQMDDDIRGQLDQRGIVCTSLRPWSESAVRQWLSDSHFELSAEQVVRVTGNWGLLLQQLAGRLQARRGQFAEALADFDADLNSRSEWEDRLGLMAQTRTIFKVLSRLAHPATSDEILQRLGGGSPERVETVLQWAKLLCYAHLLEDNRWILDPLVRRVIRKIGEDE